MKFMLLLLLCLSAILAEDMSKAKKTDNKTPDKRSLGSTLRAYNTFGGQYGRNFDYLPTTPIATAPLTASLTQLPLTPFDGYYRSSIHYLRTAPISQAQFTVSRTPLPAVPFGTSTTPFATYAPFMLAVAAAPLPDPITPLATLLSAPAPAMLFRNHETFMFSPPAPLALPLAQPNMKISGEGSSSEESVKQITYHKEKAVIVPQPIEVPVERTKTITLEKKIPVYIENRIEVPVEKPYPVEVRIPHPVPVSVPVQYPVEKPVPVHIDRPVPVPQLYPVEKQIPVPVHIPVEKPIPVPVPKPYPYSVEKQVPVSVDRPIPYPVNIPVSHPVAVLVDRPVHIDRPVPIERLVHIDRPVPVDRIIDRPVPVPFEKIVHVDSPYTVERTVLLPVPHPVPVEVTQPVFSEKHDPCTADVPSCRLTKTLAPLFQKQYLLANEGFKYGNGYDLAKTFAYGPGFTYGKTLTYEPSTIGTGFTGPFVELLVKK